MSRLRSLKPSSMPRSGPRRRVARVLGVEELGVFEVKRESKKSKEREYWPAPPGRNLREPLPGQAAQLLGCLHLQDRLLGPSLFRVDNIIIKSSVRSVSLWW